MHQLAATLILTALLASCTTKQKPPDVEDQRVATPDTESAESRAEKEATPGGVAGESVIPIELPSDKEADTGITDSPLPAILVGPKLSVLLPLTGSIASAGIALQEGILQAYFHRNTRYQIDFYDTNQMPAESLYRYALDQRANIVIGPLTREQIHAVKYSSQVINIPLNSFRRQPAVYPLSMSVNEEIGQLVSIARARDFCRAMIVVSNTEKGKRTERLIHEAWNHLNGIVVVRVALTTGSTHQATEQLKRSLQSSSMLEVVENESIVATEEEPFPFARQDVDVILMSLPTARARLLMPIMRLIGGEIPVLSTSELASSSQFNKQSEPDLIGVEYLDMPFQYEKDSKNIFLNMGADAFMLSEWLRAVEDFKYRGRTGSFLYSPSKGKTRRFLGLYQLTTRGAEPVKSADYYLEQSLQDEQEKAEDPPERTENSPARLNMQ